MKKSGMSVAMCVIKTWGNSWATSERYHEEVRLGCIFGCDAKDDLHHYLHCDPIWALFNSVAGTPRTEWDEPAEIRTCLLNPTVLRAKRIAVAYRVYHAIRLGHKEELQGALAAHLFAPVHELFLELAHYFCSEYALYHP